MGVGQKLDHFLASADIKRSAAFPPALLFLFKPHGSAYAHLGIEYGDASHSARSEPN
jgi:hypothetical protein